MERFWRNHRWDFGVRFPRVAPSLTSKQVLVESFENGRLISEYMESDEAYGKEYMATLGMQTFLNMLLRDNFVHADLHPGNLLIFEGPKVPSWDREIGEGLGD